MPPVPCNLILSVILSVSRAHRVLDILPSTRPLLSQPFQTTPPPQTSTSSSRPHSTSYHQLPDTCEHRETTQIAVQTTFNLLFRQICLLALAPPLSLDFPSISSQLKPSRTQNLLENVDFEPVIVTSSEAQKSLSKVLKTAARDCPLAREAVTSIFWSGRNRSEFRPACSPPLLR